MKLNPKIAIVALLWACTATGAFFYGYTEAAKSNILETAPELLRDLEPQPPAAPESLSDELNLTTAELDLLEKLKRAGGQELISAFAYDDAEAIADYLNLVETEDEELTLSSAEALDSILSTLSLGDPDTSKLWSLLSHIDPSDAPAALAALDRMAQSDRTYRGMVNRLISNLASEDPTKALELANSVMALTDRNSAIGAALTEWGKNDPYATLQWLEENPDIQRNTASRAVNAIFNAIAQSDPTEATALLETIGDPSARNRATNGILSAILSAEGSDLEGVVGFIASQPKQAQNGMLSTALNDNRFRSFGGGIKFAEALKSANSEAANDAYRRVVRRNARDFPEKTAARVETINDPKIQSQALKDVVEEWSRVDLAQTAEWLSKAPQDPAYDRAYREFATRNSRNDPANAITWAEAITDEKSRDQTITQIARNWISRDAEGAAAYVQATQYISDESRERILEQIEKRRKK